MKNIIVMILFVKFIFAYDLQKPSIYQGDENISGWYMSEKLDGIRGYWDGENLKTKNGKIIHAPKWFLKEFPPFELDGELWSKRGDFENIQSIVLDEKPSDDWKKITYNVFEVPHSDGNFTQRLDKIKKYKKIKHLHIIKQFICKNRNELIKFLKNVEKMGGEGVIIKNPKLPYFTGRSTNILKVKSYDDMEGKVISINKGKGKYKNMMGSLTVKLDNNVTFKLGNGFSISDRKNPPKVGDYITFKYYGLTKNKKPKFASYMRVRRDK